jgi:hypothetical protein
VVIVTAQRGTTGEGRGAWFIVPGGGRGGGPSGTGVTCGREAWREWRAVRRLLWLAGSDGHGSIGAAVAFARPEGIVSFVNYSKIFK